MRELEHKIRERLGLLANGNEFHDKLLDIFDNLFFPWRAYSPRKCPRCYCRFHEKGFRALPPWVWFSYCFHCGSKTRTMTTDEMINLIIGQGG